MAAGEGMKSSWSNHCPCGRVSLLEHIAEGRVATAVNLALRIIVGLRAVTAGRDLPFWAPRESGSSPLVPGQAEPILCSVCGGELRFAGTVQCWGSRKPYGWLVKPVVAALWRAGGLLVKDPPGPLPDCCPLPAAGLVFV